MKKVIIIIFCILVMFSLLFITNAKDDIEKNKDKYTNNSQGFSQYELFNVINDYDCVNKCKIEIVKENDKDKKFKIKSIKKIDTNEIIFDLNNNIDKKNKMKNEK